MYADFYSLKALPFQLTPDAHFYFESKVHAKAMAHLKYGLQQGEGFIVITGDIGAGKTTLVERLCAVLDSSRYVIAKVTSTQTSADDMLRMIAAGFGIKAENLNKGDLMKRFELMVVSHFVAGRRLLLLVDEAQNLNLPALEELRMLSNFIVGNKAPMQSFLLGQPQFRPIIAMPEMEQLRQRIIASYHLGPLGQDETQLYIEHRLKVAGWQSDPHFTPDAFQRIHNLTQGIPRKINTLCSRLMLFGFLEEIRTIDAVAVSRVAEELELEICGDQSGLQSAPQSVAPQSATPAWANPHERPFNWPFRMPDPTFNGQVSSIGESWRDLKLDRKQVLAGSWNNATRYVTRRFL